MTHLDQGTQILDYLIGPKIGRGAFGEIYSAIDLKTGIIWALKTETNESQRKTLNFEFKILAQVQSSPCFPRLGVYGRAQDFSFISEELLGPSLSQILKILPTHKFTLSTAIRASYHILKCIESFHIFGFVHRDIKPSNILTREGTENPLCLIDFGLSRVYINPENGQHLLARKRVGFRGTRAYASRNAHLSRDLSRRDDLISWFYIAYEFLVGKLPWRNETDKNQILICKKNFDIKASVESVIPELYEIWEHISSLDFFDAPNYSFIYHKLTEIAKNKNVSFSEPLEWTGYLKQCRKNVTDQIKNIEIERNLPILGIENSDVDLNSMDIPLIRPNITVAAPFSQTTETEGCCNLPCCPW